MYPINITAQNKFIIPAGKISVVQNLATSSILVSPKVSNSLLLSGAGGA
jgi:hypothetical protein